MNMLTKQQILLLHSQLIRQSGGSDGIRDEALSTKPSALGTD